MTRILDWLQGYPEITHTPLGDTENTTDPYVVKALITSDYFTLDTSSFAVVYDMADRPSRSRCTRRATPTSMPRTSRRSRSIRRSTTTSRRAT